MMVSNRISLFSFFKMYIQSEYVGITHHMKNQFDDKPRQFSYYFVNKEAENISVKYDYSELLEKVNSYFYKGKGR